MARQRAGLCGHSGVRYSFGMPDPHDYRCKACGAPAEVGGVLELRMTFAGGSRQFVDLVTAAATALTAARTKQAELGVELDRAKTAVLALAEQIDLAHVDVESGKEFAACEAGAAGADRTRG